MTTEETSFVPSEVSLKGLTELHSLLKKVSVGVLVCPMDVLSNVSEVCDPLMTKRTVVLQLLHQGCNRKPTLPVRE